MPLFWDISPSETTGTGEALQGSTGLPKIPGFVLPGPRISQESAGAAGEVQASRTTGPRLPRELDRGVYNTLPPPPRSHPRGRVAG